MPLVLSAAQNPLLQLTRAAIEGAVRQLDEPPPAEIAAFLRHHAEFGQSAGAFVSIEVGGELRGCLGEVEAVDPLLEVILRCARRAPIADYRFAPVRPDELPRLGFKISVLSPMERVHDLDDIVPGRDGLLVRHGGRLGLLLPEVPVEHGWDRPAWLRSLWRKAGLAHDVQPEEAELFRFTTQQIASGEALRSSAPH